MKNDLVKLIDWFRANKLSLNISKTNYVLFQSKNLKENISDCELKFGTEIIERKPYVKFLGLLIDENMNWTNQCQHIIAKLSSSLYMMNCIKNFLPIESKKSLYYSFFYSYMSYGILLWGPLINKYHFDQIIKKQKRAIRIIKNVKYNAHTDPLFKELQILSVSEIINLETSKLMYNVFKNNVPEPISDMFEASTNRHSYMTRYRNDPQFYQKPTVSAILKSFLYKGPDLWHNLDLNLKESSSLKCFTRNYKRLMFA